MPPLRPTRPPGPRGRDWEDDTDPRETELFPPEPASCTQWSQDPIPALVEDSPPDSPDHSIAKLRVQLGEQAIRLERLAARPAVMVSPAQVAADNERERFYRTARLLLLWSFGGSVVTVAGTLAVALRLVAHFLL